jgi:hypothetical protein
MTSVCQVAAIGQLPVPLRLAHSAVARGGRFASNRPKPLAKYRRCSECDPPRRECRCLRSSAHPQPCARKCQPACPTAPAPCASRRRAGCRFLRRSGHATSPRQRRRLRVASIACRSRRASPGCRSADVRERLRRTQTRHVRNSRMRSNIDDDLVPAQRARSAIVKSHVTRSNDMHRGRECCR